MVGVVSVRWERALLQPRVHQRRRLRPLRSGSQWRQPFAAWARLTCLHYRYYFSAFLLGLGALDTIGLSGAIGENSAGIRAAVLKDCIRQACFSPSGLRSPTITTTELTISIAFRKERAAPAPPRL